MQSIKDKFLKLPNQTRISKKKQNSFKSKPKSDALIGNWN